MTRYVVISNSTIEPMTCEEHVILDLARRRAGGWRCRIRVWDIDNREQIAEYDSHGRDVE